MAGAVADPNPILPINADATAPARARASAAPSPFELEVQGPSRKLSRFVVPTFGFGGTPFGVALGAIGDVTRLFQTPSQFRTRAVTEAESEVFRLIAAGVPAERAIVQVAGSPLGEEVFAAAPEDFNAFIANVQNLAGGEIRNVTPGSEVGIFDPVTRQFNQAAQVPTRETQRDQELLAQAGDPGRLEAIRSAKERIAPRKGDFVQFFDNELNRIVQFDLSNPDDRAILAANRSRFERRPPVQRQQIEQQPSNIIDVPEKLKDPVAKFLSFRRDALEAIDVFEANPGAATLTGRAAVIIDNFLQDLRTAGDVVGFDLDAGPGPETKKELDALNLNNARFRAILFGLAGQAAAEKFGSRPSDKDVQLALITLTGGSRDPAVVTAILRQVIAQQEATIRDRLRLEGLSAADIDALLTLETSAQTPGAPTSPAAGGQFEPPDEGSLFEQTVALTLANPDAINPKRFAELAEFGLTPEEIKQLEALHTALTAGRR